jgi:geranylgeranyl diphosphate synthase type II
MKMKMSDTYLERWCEFWNFRLNRYLEKVVINPHKSDHSAVLNLFSAMYYTIESGGKRLRSLMTIAAAEAVGGRAVWALPGALAIEMIHTYSLIHDDLPALDNDELRRGRPTCHLAFNEATAILAGDALQAFAFQTLASSPLRPLEDWPQRLNKALLILARAIGPRGMVGGQAMDLAFEGINPLPDDILVMDTKKTGFLVGASLAIGALLGGADMRMVDKLDRIGRQAGLAFQITDDLLNVSGDPDRMGKNVGTDAMKAKATYAAALGVDKAHKLANKLINKALTEIRKLVLAHDKLLFLVGSILNRSK